ncbi:MAG: flavodoxin domain-containing protein [Lachnospiraceae bacterium]|nr:flavodoxin domain-containing protein [Lachnospiraceae bacterium]
MSKIAVVVWTGTGNTAAMGDAVKEGAEAAGAEVSVLEFSDLNADAVAEFDGFALGCPAMGDEVLEEGEVQPAWDDVKADLANKKVALFGSYGWGDGEWMRSWEEDASDNGITLACDSVIANNAPDDEALEACKALGAALV